RRISFRDDIHPLLSRCLRCHQGTNPSSGVRLDARAELLGDSNGRPLVIPGHGAASRLVQVVLGKIEDRVMPPAGRGKRLTSAEVARLIAWIDEGLDWDDRLLPPLPVFTHWAFQPIRRPAVPVTRQRCDTPVDAFLAAGWEAKG